MANEKEIPPKEEKKVEPEKPVVSAIDKAIETGEIPQNLNEELRKEGERINQELEKEAEEKVVKEKKEKTPAKPAKEEEDELIPDEERKKYKIPDHIKTRKAAYEWGPNAEKLMLKQKAEAEKSVRLSTEVEKKLETLEKNMSEFSKVLKIDVKQGGMTEEERLVEEEKLRLLWEKSPTEAINHVIETRENKAKQEALAKQKTDYEAQIAKQKEEWNKTWDEDSKSLQEKYQEAEKNGGRNWFKEVLPAFIQITKERPYLMRGEEVEYFYLKQIREQEEKIKAEEEVKRQEKLGAGGETSHKSAEVGLGGNDSEMLSKIDSAQSIAELEKIAGFRK